jgi:hypothetical protein
MIEDFRGEFNNLKELREEFKILRQEFHHLRRSVKDIQTENVRLQKEIEGKSTFTNNAHNVHSCNQQKMTEDQKCPVEIEIHKTTIENTNRQLHNIELTLPTFDENTVNPVLHLNRLDNYINLKKLSNEEEKLMLAYKSMNSETSKQRVETIFNHVNDYKTFKKEFLNTWWSTTQQSLIKCSIYQDKYDKQANISLSAHFLKYATMATYLQPALSEIEIVEAVRFHYPLHIQRILVNVQSKKISDTLNLLKRIEIMETRESHIRNNYPRKSPPLENPNCRQTQRRTQGYHNPRNYGDSRRPTGHYYPSERVTDPENARNGERREENRRYEQSEN